MNKHIYPIEAFNTTLFIQNMSQLRILSSWQNWNFFCHLAILLLSCDLTTTSMAPKTNGENMLCRMNSDPSWGFSILNVWDFVRFLWGWFGKNGCWTKWIFYLSKMEIGGFQHRNWKQLVFWTLDFRIHDVDISCSADHHAHVLKSWISPKFGLKTYRRSMLVPGVGEPFGIKSNEMH